jgi:hypothetical protein
MWSNRARVGSLQLEKIRTRHPALVWKLQCFPSHFFSMQLVPVGIAPRLDFCFRPRAFLFRVAARAPFCLLRLRPFGVLRFLSVFKVSEFSNLQVGFDGPAHRRASPRSVN